MQDTSITREDVARGAQIGLIAFIIAGVYAILVTMLIYSFSAYVIRSDWDMTLSQQADGIGAQDFDELVYLIDRDREIGTLIAEANDMLRSLENQLLDVETQAADLDDRKERFNSEMESHLRIVKAHLSGASFDLIDTEKARMVTLLGSASITHTTARTGLFLLEKATFRTGVPEKRMQLLAKDTGELGDKLDALFDQRSEMLRDEATHKANAVWAEARYGEAEQTRDDHIAARTALREKLPVYSEHRGRLEALDGVRINRASAAEDGAPPPRQRVMGTLVRLPPILLTLMATIAAGALGTLVAYTRTRFVGEKEPKISELTIAIGEGVAAAIGVFLFAGAGLLSLSQGGAGPETLDLSPYMVAFLAFLSGLMAESAFAKITGYGKVLFRVDDK